MTFWKNLFESRKPPSICEAAKRGDLKTVEALLKKNPDLVNAKNNDGDTPLIGACRVGRVDVVKLLITAGANIETEGRGSTTRLSAAAQGGFSEVEGMLRVTCA